MNAKTKNADSPKQANRDSNSGSTCASKGGVKVLATNLSEVHKIQAQRPVQKERLK